MKRFLSSLALVLLSLSVMAPMAEAKRFGGGGFSGMKRTVPPKSPDTTPARPATPAPANAAAPAAPPAAAAASKRSWMGPLAGLAAGLGIGALLSHLGLGAGLADLLTMLLIAGVAFLGIRFLLRRFGPQRAAANDMQFAGAGSANAHPAPPWSAPALGSGAVAGAAGASSASAARLPADFDTAGFERIAKLIFIRMQAANDAGDQADLRAFTTPEMFASVKLDLQDRRGAPQQTDVVELNAEVIDQVQETSQQVVSVRFHGLIREEQGSVASAFDEVWHLVRPADGSRDWAIAGIAPYA